MAIRSEMQRRDFLLASLGASLVPCTSSFGIDGCGSSETGKGEPTEERFPRGECVDFRNVGDQLDGSTYSAGWVTFVSNDGSKLELAGLSLRVPDAGITMKLKRGVKKLTIVGGSGDEGDPDAGVEGRKLYFVASDKDGNPLDQGWVGNYGSVTLDARGDEGEKPFIVEVLAKGRGTDISPENEVESVCLPTFDFDEIVEQEIRDAQSSNPEIARMFRDHESEVKSTLDKLVAEARPLYEGKRDPREYVIGLKSSFIDLGIPPLKFSWPPAWDCVFRELVKMAVVSAAIAFALEAAGFATISEMAAAEVAGIAAKYGFTATEVTQVYYAIEKAIGVGLALHACG